MRFFLVTILLVSGCGCDAVVYDALSDGGLSQPYCGQECVTDADCSAGWHCSLHPWDPKGICFLRFDAGQ
jgi:hypothetical protein